MAMTNSRKREIFLKLLNLETLFGLGEISEFLMQPYMNKFHVWKSDKLNLTLKLLLLLLLFLFFEIILKHKILQCQACNIDDR